jgi:hypothetical protein
MVQDTRSCCNVVSTVRGASKGKAQLFAPQDLKAQAFCFRKGINQGREIWRAKKQRTAARPSMSASTPFRQLLAVHSLDGAL